MLTVQQIIKSIEMIAPLSWAEKWDNCGLVVGDLNADADKALVTLDVEKSTLEEAIKNGCQLIISHHPPVFQPIKQITTATPVGQLLLMAITNKINLYVAHTNFDSAQNGLSTYLVRLIGLKDLKVLKPRIASVYATIVVFVPSSHLATIF